MTVRLKPVRPTHEKPTPQSVFESGKARSKKPTDSSNSGKMTDCNGQNASVSPQHCISTKDLPLLVLALPHRAHQEPSSRTFQAVVIAPTFCGGHTVSENATGLGRTDLLGVAVPPMYSAARRPVATRGSAPTSTPARVECHSRPSAATALAPGWETASHGLQASCSSVMMIDGFYSQNGRGPKPKCSR